jgi:hypothetical protein
MRFERERAALKRMTTELQDYLLSDVAFWQLGGSSDFPKLSLGSYLLTRTRLSADPDQAAEVTALNQQADSVLAQWSATAERKAAGELHTRVHLWETFLAEGQGRYATEVAQRVMIALLLGRFPRLAETPEGRSLAALDDQLRARSWSGPFVWDAELQPAFPEDDFWFLYLSTRPGT